MKVVLDTNVLVSALVFGGKPQKVLQAAISGKVRLVSSSPLLDELKGVLEGPKFQYPLAAMKTIMNQLLDIADIVTPSRHINRITSDPDDNQVLECAVEGDVNFIVSGDPDLLDINEFEGIPILTPAQFLDRM